MTSKENMLLTRDQVKAAINFQRPPRPVRAEVLWHNQETQDHFGQNYTDLLEKYPDDVLTVHIGIEYEYGKEDDSNYRWAYKGWEIPASVPIDNCPIITDWAEIDNFIRDFPDANRSDAMEPVKTLRDNNPDRYILVNWGHFFHQRLAYIRGIENLLYDLHDHQEKLFQLMDALLGFYEIWAKRTALAGGDGVWAGDDLGHQNGLFMSPKIFRKVYKPYYSQLAEILHNNKLDFWLHTCGNVSEIMDDLIEAGVDVIHPIQAGCMDPAETFGKYGGQIAFWIGMDVQHLVPFGSTEEIRIGTIKRAKEFYRPDGGIIYGAGNTLVAGIPFENIETYASSVFEFCQQSILQE